MRTQSLTNHPTMLSFTPDATQNMRLRDDPPPITQPARPTKKRKTPPTNSDNHQQQLQQAPPPQQQQTIQVLPPPHALIHQITGQMPPGYPYGPSDYTPGGLPQTSHPGVSIQQQPGQPNAQSQQQQGAASRTLSNSKRAEQNRKAQRAFRERRDQCVLFRPFSFLSCQPSSFPDMSRLSSQDQSSSMQLLLRQMKLTVVGKSVEPWSTNSVLKMLHYELRLHRLICCLPISTPQLLPPWLLPLPTPFLQPLQSRRNINPRTPLTLRTIPPIRSRSS